MICLCSAIVMIAPTHTSDYLSNHPCMRLQDTLTDISVMLTAGMQKTDETHYFTPTPFSSVIVQTHNQVGTSSTFNYGLI